MSESSAPQSIHYQPAAIEKRWQNQWRNDRIYQTPQNSDGEAFYALSMFPYPSGKLHMGHVRNYVITDVIARAQRMRGKRVLHPMGWDAFGLPAENAAIERGIDPSKWTNTNIQQMRKQLDQLGLSIDWEREISTCNEDYYRWTQWLFLQFYDAGLAYQQEATVNWDPIDQTVLANEQVNGDGCSWRSGAKVEKRKLRQWFLRITNYAEILLRDLDQLTGWPERVRTMQANWIGRSKGCELSFLIYNEEDRLTDQFITVFTTRPDTICGISYIAVSVDHDIVSQSLMTNDRSRIQRFCKEISFQKDNNHISSDQIKQGIPLGKYACHPLNGRRIPIWIADYVLADHGTGAVMGVPAHDQRDFIFAHSYGLIIKPVIISENTNHNQLSFSNIQSAFIDLGKLIKSGIFDSLSSEEAGEAILSQAQLARWGQSKITYKLHDWLISRQRYWGCPIPIIHCQSCGTVPVPTTDLPVELPKNLNLQGKGGSPLSLVSKWVKTSCPKCGQIAQRETDTMDTFMCSSWYFLRYSDPSNKKEPFSSEKIQDWLPVNHYVGGIEHAILHLLYSRFFTKVLNDRGLLNFSEPFIRLLPQGMVQGITYKVPSTGEYIPVDNITDLDNPIDPNSGEVLEVIFEKMSKSKGNGVDPTRVIEHFGADTARMFILFKAPPEKDLEWNESDVEGQFRFLQRISRLVEMVLKKGIRLNLKEDLSTTINSKKLNKDEQEVHRATHYAIAAITEDLDGEVQLNTAIAELMKLNNILSSVSDSISEPIILEGLKTLIILLAPFAPHLSEELWSRLVNDSNSIHNQRWPILDPSALIQENIKLVIQVNGRVRGFIDVPANADKEKLEKLALNSESAQKWISGKLPKRVITVPGKLVNIVL
uniref:leucine--tRNA ligase n=1 Tax=Paulinella chromatophora TaxID=39717 RepID=B1X3T6_PAUCH|nr:t-RNA synthetase, class Ia:Leucyl-tRNA synthetase [Paulinella chromatophora]ACB42605.1 t-RNA synthetase, class Ia:Leucyl-tRNA synthetase [Paulinella chromatophora]